MNKINKYIFIGLSLLGVAAVVSATIAVAIIVAYNFIVGL
jgi:hypothetical protein